MCSNDTFSLLSRPSNDLINEFINNLKNKYLETAEIDFKIYENDRYNDLYKYHKKYNFEQYGELGDFTEKILIHGTDESNMKSIFETMKRDKKVQDGKIHFVLLEEIGKAVIVNDVKKKTIINALECL